MRGDDHLPVEPVERFLAYLSALRHIGVCVGCKNHRRLVAPPGPHATTCAVCAGAAGTGLIGHVCAGCGGEDKRFERGYCDRCSLARRTDALLADAVGGVPPALDGVRDAIVATGNSAPR